MAIRRIDDPELLKPQLFRKIDPGFPARVKPGDVVVAGENFASGKPHLLGFIAMASLKLGLVCVSMPYKAMRGAISKGVPVLTGLSKDWVFASGDAVSVDFVTGKITNITRDETHRLEPIDPNLGAIVAAGGSRGLLARWLQDHPEMSVAPEPLA
jgi:3-isopropylmalate/(R)-2-methylmalate dehydratase small subunit